MVVKTSSESAGLPSTPPISGSPAACHRFELPEFALAEGDDEYAALDATHKRAHRAGFAEGRDQGFREGYRDGEAAGGDAVRAAVASLGAVLDVLAAPLEQLDSEVEQSLVGLTTAIVRQLVRRELKADPGQILATVREGAAALPVSVREVHLWLQPEDAALVRANLSVDGPNASRHLHEDPLVSRGGCRIETGESHVDATVEGRLAAVISQVFGGERNDDV